MKVLFVVSECAPFIKTGGLADVAGALPKELRKLGIDVRLILPKHSLIQEQFKSKMVKLFDIRIQLGWRNQYCGIELAEIDGLTYYFVDNEYYFKRDEIYGHHDDGERFSYFCRAVLDVLPHLDFQPNILHCHDWHTGMIPFLLKTEYAQNPFYQDMKTVFTIHNLQFQGIFPKEILTDVLNISEAYFTRQFLEFYGQVNFMKAALISADFITTVSPTYKNEILTSHYGEKLEGVLRERGNSFSGILNGIDDNLFNPKDDQDIFLPYEKSTLEKKLVNKRKLQELLEFPQNEEIPVMAMITRLTKQKGLDLIKAVVHEFINEDLQFVVLGTGDYEYEQFFKLIEYFYPEKVKVNIGFDEGLARKIYAGADMLLMPSLFEPCGLSQLIALKYGTIPIVRETGGLNDTVESFNEYTGKGNGFSFANFNAHDMLFTMKRALYYYKNKLIWKQLMESAMSSDNSWAQSARQYQQLFLANRKV